MDLRIQSTAVIFKTFLIYVSICGMTEDKFWCFTRVGQEITPRGVLFFN